MTSAYQMSSRKPPVRQSTFGFPDDSTPGRTPTSVGQLGTSPRSLPLDTTPRASALNPCPNLRSALRAAFGVSPKVNIPSTHRSPSATPSNFNPQPEISSSLPCPQCLAWLIFSTSKNVEKISFQARVFRFCSNRKNLPRRRNSTFCPIHPALLFEPLSVSSPSPPSRSLRPLREALSSPALNLCGRNPASILQSVPFRLGQNVPPRNVEKLSFGPHRLACTSKRKKYFHAPHCPILSHFQHFARFSRVRLCDQQFSIWGARRCAQRQPQPRPSQRRIAGFREQTSCLPEFRLYDAPAFVELTKFEFES